MTINRQKSKRTPGFTLVELLVVITIIGILASLLLVALSAARITAKKSRIRSEINSLDGGFAEYTNDVSNGAYPPNVYFDPDDSNGPYAADVNNLKRHFSSSFPKHREPTALILSLAGANTSGGTVADNLQNGLTPYEAVVFWLGGFSGDPKFPLSGQGGPSFAVSDTEDWSSRRLNSKFDFSESQLGPRNGNTFNGRYIEYSVDLNGNGNTNDTGERRRINLWQYVPPNLNIPYAYIDASRRPVHDFNCNGVVPIKKLKPNVRNPENPTIADLEWANAGKCQLLSAGADDSWGNMAGLMYISNYNDTGSEYTGVVFPNGPFTAEAADNITNLADVATLEDAQP